MKKNFWILLCITALLTLPWLGFLDFHTKGEPREAIVSLTMIDQDNWIMPHNNGGEIAYKPPFMHWCVAAVSSVVGVINEFTARFPSALSCILMVVWTYAFYARRRNPDTALLTGIVCFTSFEVFRAAYACRVDMVLAFCIVGAILAFGRWVEHPSRRGVPWLAILLMSLGALTKGPVAIALPCGVAGVYLLLRGENFFRTFFSLFAIAISCLILPALWYYAAYQQAGDAFLSLIYDENLGRFLGRMSYKSHDNGIWYYFVMFPAGLLPWTLVFIPALFRKKNWCKLKERLWSAQFSKIRTALRDAEPVTLYSAVAAVVIFVFYCIPESKRGVYLLPLYPFVSYFVAVFLIKNWKPIIIKRVSRIVVGIWALAYIVVLPFILNPKSDLKTARIIEEKVGNAYLTSFAAGGAKQNPHHYFTINFYLRNRVDSWKPEGPKSPEGYFIVGEKDAPEFIKSHADYTFVKVDIPPHRSCDMKQNIELYHFQRNTTLQQP